MGLCDLAWVLAVLATRACGIGLFCLDPAVAYLGQRFWAMVNLTEPSAGRGWQGWATSGGNWAFDDYRADTLRSRREQREFQAYLGRLRHAHEKAEFTAERCNQPGTAPPTALEHGSPTVTA